MSEKFLKNTTVDSIRVFVENRLVDVGLTPKVLFESLIWNLTVARLD